MIDLLVIGLVLGAALYAIYHIRKTLTHGERESARCDVCAVKKMSTTTKN